MEQVVGKFHPLLVHLPIGFLAMVLILKIFSLYKLRNEIENLMPTLLFLSLLASVFSCVTGYILNENGSYPSDLVSYHKWISIALTFIVAAMYLIKNPFTSHWIFYFLIFALLIITGHLGGSLTHGDDYFYNKKEDSIAAVKKITNLQEAKVYDDIISPILQNKCYKCHNENKQKGGLRLDQASFITKGGKHGEILMPGVAQKSLLYERIMLDVMDEHHMPPKNNPPLKENEIKLIKWWIDQKASFDAKVKELTVDAEINTILTTLQSKATSGNAPMLPPSPIEPAKQTDIDKLKKTGAVVTCIAGNTNYLSVNISNLKSFTNTDLMLLGPLFKHVVRLKAANAPLGDSLLLFAGQCNNLFSLQLNGTKITNNGLKHLTALTSLQYLNLTNTAINNEGLFALKPLTHLKTIYLYQTAIDKKKMDVLYQLFPKTTIDTGGYVLPLLEGDTLMVKW